MNGKLTFADGTEMAVSGVSNLNGQCKVFPTEDRTILDYVQIFTDPEKTKKMTYDTGLPNIKPTVFEGYTDLAALTISIANHFYYFVLEVDK